jgi:hypothetical protein
MFKIAEMLSKQRKANNRLHTEIKKVREVFEVLSMNAD